MHCYDIEFNTNILMLSLRRSATKDIHNYQYGGKRYWTKRGENQNKRTVGSSYVKNVKESIVFMKETTGYHKHGLLKFSKKLRIAFINISKPIFWIFSPPPCKWVYNI